MNFLTASKKILVAGLAIGALIACSDGAQKLERKPRTKLKVTKKKELETKNEILVLARIPGPSENFTRLKPVLGKFNASLLSVLTQTDSLVIGSLQAGYLLADLTYSGAFERKKEVLRILADLNKSNQGLGMVDSTALSFLALSHKTKGYKDSLKKITTERYTDFLAQLRNRGRTDVVTFVRIGTWIETMHILLSTPVSKKNQKEMDAFLSAQKLVVDNLLILLVDEKNNIEVEFFRDKLSTILESFDAMKANVEAITVSKEGDTYVVKGGKKIEVDRPSLLKLKTLIVELKNYGVDELD